MNWRAKQDRDSFKEAWLCLDNDRGRFPLYPGQHSTIEYGYQVDDGRWGPWFQRAVRLPTRRLSVELVFPAGLDPVVWGTETSTTAEAVPLRTPITRTEDGDRLVFSWATQDPPMGARYRLEWRFRARDDDIDQHRPDLRTASDRMKAAGIVQRGEPILATTAWPSLFRSSQRLMSAPPASRQSSTVSTKARIARRLPPSILLTCDALTWVR
jgi:hypothetical protein